MDDSYHYFFDTLVCLYLYLYLLGYLLICLCVYCGKSVFNGFFQLARGRYLYNIIMT
jgi:hypothetical protein